jgi:CHAT domain-containing protein/tetratricopeptide (TPR) repeat protein
MTYRRWFYPLLAIATFCWITILWPIVLPGMLVGLTQPAPTATVPTSALEQGRTAYQAGRLTEAVAFWQQAAQAYGQQGDWLNQALSLSYLSLAYQDLGAWEDAEVAIAHSLELLQTQPELTLNARAVLAQAWTAWGSLELNRGDLVAALEHWQTAEELYSQLEDQQGVWGSRINQAQALQTLGYYRQAQQLLEQVQGELQAQPMSVLQVAGLRSLGTVWQRVGDLEEARRVLQTGLAIARQLGIPAEISATQFALGNTLRLLNDPAAALPVYRQAADTAPTPLTQLQARVNQFSLLADLERWPQAQTLIEGILPELNSLSSSRPAVLLQVNAGVTLMAHLEHWTGDRLSPMRIGSLLSHALHQAQLLQDGRAMTQAQGQLGKLYERTGQWAIAADLTTRALQQAQSIDAGDIVYRWQAQLGRIRQHQGDRDGALVAYGDAIATIQAIRNDLLALNAEIQGSFSETVEPIYRQFVDLLIPVETTPEQGVAAARDAVETLYLIQQTAGDELHQARRAIEGLHIAELEQYLRSACLGSDTTNLDTTHPSAAVVYPIILEQRLVILLSLPDTDLLAYSIPVPSTELETEVNQFLRSLNPVFSEGDRLHHSQRLYDWLIRPALPQLVDHQIETLVFVPDGILRNLPLATLHDGSHYLVEQFAIALSPGMQLLDPGSNRSQSPEQVLFGGLTEARQGFVSLPGVAEESRQIAAKTSTQVILNQQFNQATLQAQLQDADYPYIHLATHGQFSSDPEQTFLLTWDDRLTIDELRTLLLSRTLSGNPIELLTLSACETATGDPRAALGLAGLAVRSGARSTLATLWAVNDASTAALMTHFYQQLIAVGQSKAESLRQAQIALLRSADYQHPYYWAPFVLVGDWQ